MSSPVEMLDFNATKKLEENTKENQNASFMKNALSGDDLKNDLKFQEEFINYKKTTEYSRDVDKQFNIMLNAVIKRRDIEMEPLETNEIESMKQRAKEQAETLWFARRAAIFNQEGYRTSAEVKNDFGNS